MKIFLTGAAGKVGRALARQLLERGHELRLFDLAPVERELAARCEVVYGDLTDRLTLLNGVAGCEAVAHLGAVPNPVHGNELELFGPNVLGTQYLLAAAQTHGIQRFVYASSGCVYGFPFQSSGTLKPLYLPMDEDHPQRPEDLYGLSKSLAEQTMATYTRRYGMTTLALRLIRVIYFQHTERWMERMLRHAHDRPDTDLWGYVELQDAARAFCLALECQASGYHVMGIVARDMVGPAPARVRIEAHYPDLVSFLDADFPFEEWGFWDTRRAEAVIGWKSQNHWRDFLPLDTEK